MEEVRLVQMFSDRQEEEKNAHILQYTPIHIIYMDNQKGSVTGHVPVKIGVKHCYTQIKLFFYSGDRKSVQHLWQHAEQYYSE